MDIKMILTVIAIALDLAGCDSNNSRHKDNLQTATTMEAISELSFPVPPDSLTEPGERAAFAAGHFLDTLDFRNRSRSTMLLWSKTSPIFLNTSTKVHNL